MLKPVVFAFVRTFIARPHLHRDLQRFLQPFESFGAEGNRRPIACASSPFASPVERTAGSHTSPWRTPRSSWRRSTTTSRSQPPSREHCGRHSRRNLPRRPASAPRAWRWHGAGCRGPSTSARSCSRAYFADALPLEIFKREQERITTETALAQAEIQRVQENDGPYQALLEFALSLVRDARHSYSRGDPYAKRLRNQAPLDRIELAGGQIMAVRLRPPFDHLFSWDGSNGGCLVGRPEHFSNLVPRTATGPTRDVRPRCRRALIERASVPSWTRVSVGGTSGPGSPSTARPGPTRPAVLGDAVIDGHLDWTNGPTVIWRLGQLLLALLLVAALTLPSVSANSSLSHRRWGHRL